MTRSSMFQILLRRLAGASRRWTQKSSRKQGRRLGSLPMTYEATSVTEEWSGHTTVRRLRSTNSTRPTEICLLLNERQRLTGEINRICRLADVPFLSEIPEGIALFLSAQSKIEQANETLKVIEKKLADFGWEEGFED